MPLLSLAAGAGTQADVVQRLRALLPVGWFADSSPILDSLLSGLAGAWQALFGLLAYVQAQSRIATATGVFLDLVAQDFFAGRLTRQSGEPDDILRGRITANLLPSRNTRNALMSAVQNLTGRAPSIVEPARIADTGAYNVPATLAYNTVGAWGSFGTPFQVFVHAYRPLGIGVSNCAGYNVPIGGYAIGALQYTTPTMAASDVSDADIQATVASVIPIATSAWVAISNG